MFSTEKFGLLILTTLRGGESVANSETGVVALTRDETIKGVAEALSRTGLLVTGTLRGISASSLTTTEGASTELTQTEEGSGVEIGLRDDIFTFGFILRALGAFCG